MTWLARLKKTAAGPDAHPQKPTKPGFGGFVGTPTALSQKLAGDVRAANDPAHAQDFDPEAFKERASVAQLDGGLNRPDAEAMAAQAVAFDPDGNCWPNTNAMNTAEVDTFMTRVHLFDRRGISTTDAESMADTLVRRDREADDRRLCLECSHLRRSAGLWRCGQSEQACLPVADLPGDVVNLLQRCSAFDMATR